MFKWLSLNNFCMSFFIFSALEPLTILNTASHRPCISQYLFYYNPLKVGNRKKEGNYQRLRNSLFHRMLPWLHQTTLLSFLSVFWIRNIFVFGHFSRSELLKYLGICQI